LVLAFVTHDAAEESRTSDPPAIDVLHSRRDADMISPQHQSDGWTWLHLVMRAFGREDAAMTLLVDSGADRTRVVTERDSQHTTACGTRRACQRS
jgi:hypothetical protein